jgi:hypothetical protein
MILRRRVVQALTATAMSAVIRRAAAAGTGDPSDDDVLTSRLSGVVRAYDAQGIHRTATEVDHQSAVWLAQLLRERGLAPQLEPFSIDRVDLEDAYLEIGQHQIGGVPLFDAGFTPPHGIAGKLGGDIGLISASPLTDTARPNALRAALDGPSKALVIVTTGGRTGLSLINAARFRAPAGAPALQISDAHGDWLTAQAKAGVDVRLVASAHRTAANAFNVAATVQGADSTRPPLAVMTPRSGWWHCAGERAGGIGAWLEIARAVAAARPARTVHFVATSGHELGQIGLDAYLERRPALATGAAMWVHFGANIGAGPHIRLQASGNGIQGKASAALMARGLMITERVPPGTEPGGEAGTIFRKGGRYVSLQGDNELFHNPADRWPEAIDVRYAARQAAAFQDLVLELAA